MIFSTIILILSAIIHSSTSLPMGGNMNGLADWSRTLPYVNLVRQARKWGTADSPFNGNATIDPATGWPTEDFGMILASENLDLGGRYLFHAIGNASIGVWGGGKAEQTYDPTTNTLTANITLRQGSDGIVMTFRNTTGPGLRNVSLLQPGYNLSRAADFTDLFVAHLSRFNVIRFMDWTDTNGNFDTYWNQTTPVDWPQYRNGRHNPWQSIPNLVNQFNTSTDVWINIPHNSTDDYIINLARLMFDQLNPRSNIYTEYSNEVWNWYFPQQWANSAAANDSVRNHGDPYHFAYDNATDLTTWSNRRIAYQAKRISDLFKIVFGEENVGPFKRVRPILSCAGPTPHFAIDVLDYLNNNYGPPTNFIHGIAFAPYFSIGPYQRWNNLTVDKVLEGFNISVQSMLPEQGWSQQQTIGVHGTYAAWYNLSVHAYEGGTNTVDGCSNCSFEAKVNATRDPRLTDICVEHLKGWYRYGFEPYNWYSAGASMITLYGSWSLLEDMRQETRIDTTHMFNSTSPVAKLPRPAPKPKAIDIIRDTPDSSITLSFGISLPAYNFNATNYMNHPVSLPYPDLRNLTVNSSFFYPIQIFQSPMKLNLTVYVAGNAGVLEAAINNGQFTQVQTPQTFNTTTFQPTPTIQFNINQTKIPSIVALRLKNLQTGYSIRSFDLVPITKTMAK